VGIWTEEPVMIDETSRLLIPSIAFEVVGTSDWANAELNFGKSFHIKNSLAITGISKMTLSLRCDKIEHSDAFSGEEESWSCQIVHQDMLPKNSFFDERIDCKPVAETLERGSSIACMADCLLFEEIFLSISEKLESISSQLFEAETDGWDWKIGWRRDWEVLELGMNFFAIKLLTRIVTNMSLNWIVPYLEKSKHFEFSRGFELRISPDHCLKFVNSKCF
jgi:hypothetical protein